jgi:hypothetical protein
MLGQAPLNYDLRSVFIEYPGQSQGGGDFEGLSFCKLFTKIRVMVV